MNTISKTEWPLENGSYVLDLLYEHRYGIDRFIADEYGRYKAGLVKQYNFAYEITALMLSTFNPGFRLLNLADTNFIMRLSYNISDYRKNVINKLNSSGKFQLYNKLSGNNSILTKQMYVWLAACTIPSKTRETLLRECFPIFSKMCNAYITKNREILPESCSTILEAHNEYSSKGNKNAYYMNRDSIRCIEELDTINRYFIYNIKYTKALDGKSIEVYSANSEYYSELNTKIRNFVTNQKERDTYINVMTCLSSLISHGADRNSIAIVFVYDKSGYMSMFFTNMNHIQSFMVSVPSERLVCDFGNDVRPRVKEYYCIDKRMDKSRIIGYILRDKDGNTIEFERNALREMIASGEIYCSNIRLYRNGALRKID